MLGRLRETKLLLPTVMVLLMLPVLIGLGFWQLDRLSWKEGLLAAIAARTTAEPVEVTVFAGGIAAKPAIESEYARVKARGRYLHDKELYFYAPSPTMGPGYFVFTPFIIAGSGQTTMVNRGFVPEALKAPQLRSEGQTGGDVEIVGLARLPQPQARFVPDNDPKLNLWFWRDFDGMIAAAFAGSAKPDAVLPFFIDAEGVAAGGWPKGGVTELKLANRHLEYALTWFGLAAALAAVYAMYAIGRLKRIEHPV